MTLNKIIIAGALAAFVLPSAALAQDAKPAGTVMAQNADTTGNYTIIRRSSTELGTEGSTSSTTANTNTTGADIQDTIAANPGLAEALQSEGVMVSEIGSISIEPNGQVVVYDK